MYQIINPDKSIVFDGFENWYEAVSLIQSFEPNSIILDDLGKECVDLDCEPIGEIHIFIHDDKIGLEKYIFSIIKKA